MTSLNTKVSRPEFDEVIALIELCERRSQHVWCWGRRFCYALGCGDECAALLRREGEWQIINVGCVQTSCSRGQIFDFMGYMVDAM